VTTKAVIVITLVYWNVSCRPVKVASIDRGVVSIWHMPDAEHRAEHGCNSLLGSNPSVDLLSSGKNTDPHKWDEPVASP
jgi:hypothetical protein